MPTKVELEDSLSMLRDDYDKVLQELDEAKAALATASVEIENLRNAPKPKAKAQKSNVTLHGCSVKVKGRSFGGTLTHVSEDMKSVTLELKGPQKDMALLKSMVK